MKKRSEKRRTEPEPVSSGKKGALVWTTIRDSDTDKRAARKRYHRTRDCASNGWGIFYYGPYGNTHYRAEQITRKQAIRRGLEPCKKCRP